MVIAKTYRQAQVLSPNSLVAWTANRHGVGVASMHRYLQRCRDKGLLPPARTRGEKQ
jgi:hypothetical protein